MERLAEVDRLFEAIGASPAATRRRLLTSPEGVDKLIGAMHGIRHQLGSGRYKGWEPKDRAQIEAFFGGDGRDFPVSRTDALLEALEPGEVAHLASKAARREWARAEFARLVDAELARLAALRAAIDATAIEQDRLEAADRALFDPGPDALLARRYEAAATRGFFRALGEFHDAEARHTMTDADDIAVDRGDAARASNEEHDDRRRIVPLKSSRPVLDHPSDGEISEEDEQNMEASETPDENDSLWPPVRRNEPNRAPQLVNRRNEPTSGAPRDGAPGSRDAETNPTG